MNLVTYRCCQILAVSALAFGLAACGKSDEGQTAGQKLDSAISQTKEAAENAGAKIEEGAAKAGDKLGEVANTTGARVEEGATRAGEVLDDAGITARIKTDLIKEPDISALKIDVDTKGKAVTLTGTVPSEALKTRAGEIAAAVQGVSNVNNMLTVQPN